MFKQNLVICVAVFFCSFALFSCSGNDDNEEADAGDVGNQTGKDAGKDAGDDTGGDAGDDTGDNAGDDQGEPEKIVVTITADSHKIVLDTDASASERHAAEELQTYFNQCFNTEATLLEGVQEDASVPMIVVGSGEIAKSLGIPTESEETGTQGFIIRTVPPHIVISGTKQAGTLHGVHRFLEDYFGVRWYAPGVTKTPELNEVALPEIDRLEKPAFFWRNTSYEWPGRDDDFMSHMGDNSGSDGVDSPYGKKYSHDGRAHSYFTYINPDEYFDTHPEYFSEIGGVRVKKDTQLCLTNPDVLEIVTEKMLQRMADNPDVQQHNFSQMDHYNYCQCDKCRAINEKYGTVGGTQFWFVNQLAERTSKVYPDKLIGTLAYMYTEEPPKGLEMHPNVAVWLCHMFPSCDSHSIDKCPLNANYKRRAQAWSKIIKHLYIWHYITDFAHYYNPFPNFRAMAADMKFYRDIGVEGIFLQGMGHSGGGGEFSLLRPYLGMKLLWNPDQDLDEMRKDFLEGYYGGAWEPINDYTEMLHNKVDDENIHMHLYTNPAQGYLTDDVMKKAEAYFDDAEKKVADDAELLDRVKVARMPLTYANSFPRNGYDIKRSRIHWLSDIAELSEVQDFIKQMEAHGFQYTREVAGEAETYMTLYLLIASDPEIYTISNEYLEVDIVPNLGGRALRITDLESGKCVTSYDVKEGMFFPFTGGVEDRIGPSFSFYGWVEPASVKLRSDNSIKTSQTTVDSFKVERTMTLEPGKRVLTIETVVSNPTDGAKEAQFRNHIEWDLGDVYTTEVKFTNKAGDITEHDMEPVIAELREGIHYYDTDAPNGSWTFSGSKGLQVTQSFDPDSVDFAWIYSYPDTFNETEIELWALPQTLQPGESMTFKHSIEVKQAE